MESCPGAPLEFQKKSGHSLDAETWCLGSDYSFLLRGWGGDGLDGVIDQDTFLLIGGKKNSNTDSRNETTVREFEKSLKTSFFNEC